MSIPISQFIPPPPPPLTNPPPHRHFPPLVSILLSVLWSSRLLCPGPLQLPQLRTDPKVPGQGYQQSYTKTAERTEGEKSTPRALSSELSTSPAQLFC